MQDGARIGAPREVIAGMGRWECFFTAWGRGELHCHLGAFLVSSRVGEQATNQPCRFKYYQSARFRGLPSTIEASAKAPFGPKTAGCLADIRPAASFRTSAATGSVALPPMWGRLLIFHVFGSFRYRFAQYLGKIFHYFFQGVYPSG